MMAQPSRLTFWRFVLLVTAALAFLSAWQVFGMANRLDVSVFASKTLLLLLSIFSLVGLISPVAFGVTFSERQTRMLDFLESGERFRGWARWLGIPLLLVALFGYSAIFAYPYTLNLFASEGWIRCLIFWGLCLVGLTGFKMLWKQVPWLTGLMTLAVVIPTVHLVLVYLPRITDYPFSMGWSETSRYYYPSLFLSKMIYGQRFPWPILHPSLHLLLVPPYLFNAPLWFHRLWQVILRLVLVGLIVPALLPRLKIENRLVRWLVGTWMFLYLFMGPIYLHLAVPVILVLWGYSSQNDRRTWLVVILASIWSGLSRLNWYPMPGIIAATLYLLEVPLQQKNRLRYLLKPILWFMVGTGIAFGTQQVYIALSGIPNVKFFYTSLTSNLLWYRLWPNASYNLGVLPGILLASFPIWLAMFLVAWPHRVDWHPLRMILILVALLVLLAGGIVVSLKIGGGANLHNMDAYFSLLLVVFAYFVFARYRREDGGMATPVVLPWPVVVLLIIMPAWSWLQFNISPNFYNPEETQHVLARLQANVDLVNAQGGEILFITQRHLISMHILQNVTLIPEYEREELMEMAMGNNENYLSMFRSNIESQRFAMIVVDPLKVLIQGSSSAMGEENDAWVRSVVKPILCNYQVKEEFEADNVVIYVPQEGARQCP